MATSQIQPVEEDKLSTAKSPTRVLPAIKENGLFFGFVVSGLIIIVLLGYFAFISPTLVGTAISAFLIGSMAYLGIHRQNVANDARQQALISEQTKQQTNLLKHQARNLNRQLRDSQKQLTIRLDHESEQKRKDREVNLKRDIFLNAVEAFGRLEQYLLTFPDINHTPESRGALLEGTLEKLNQPSLVTNLEAIIKMTEFDSYYRQSLFKLLEMRTNLDYVRAESENLETLLTSLQHSNDQITQLLSSKPLPPNINVVELQNAFLDNQKKYESYTEIWRGKTNFGLQLWKQLNAEAFDITANCTVMGAKIIVIFRRELNLPIDEENYIKIITENINKDIEIAKAEIGRIIESQAERFGLTQEPQ